MIKFRLTIFALPFAFTGVFLAADGLPEPGIFLWVIVAMVGARTAAMGFNRIVDRRFDGANPRTADRALPAGKIKMTEAWGMVAVASLLFFLACFMLNRLTLLLSPLALGITFFYSLTKRFTSLCHLILGVALAFSPLGGWAAVRGSLDDYPVVLSFGVLFWIAGFDTIYGCLDAEFDRQKGLYSLPSRFGRKRAFLLAVFFHVSSFVFFVLTGIICDLNHFYYIGVGITGAVLFSQHVLVSLRGLSRIKASFFALNGTISVILFLATWLSLSTS